MLTLTKLVNNLARKRRSAVELSPHRKEIEEMILEGKSDRAISDWLSTVEESISYGAIYNYRRTKFNITKEATLQYNEKESKQRKKKAVAKKIGEIEFLDDIIDLAGKTDLQVNYDARITPLDIKKLGVQAVRAKHEITKDEPDPVVVEVNVNGVPTDPKVRARGRDFIQQIRAGQVESSNPGDGDQ